MNELPAFVGFLPTEGFKGCQVHAWLDFGENALAQHVHGQGVQFNAPVAVLGDEGCTTRVGRFGEIGRQVVAGHVLVGEGAFDDYWPCLETS